MNGPQISIRNNVQAGRWGTGHVVIGGSLGLGLGLGLGLPLQEHFLGGERSSSSSSCRKDGGRGIISDTRFVAFAFALLFPFHLLGHFLGGA